MQKSTYVQEVNRILASMNTNGSDASKDLQPLDTPLKEEKAEEYDVYIEPDRVTIIKRTEERLTFPEPPAQVTDALQQPPQRQPHPYFAYIAMTICLLLIIYLVTSAILTVFFPPTVTITLLLKAQTIKATGTLQLPARQILPITLSQSQSVPTTGRGHQTAKNAYGYIVFYNGQLNEVTIPSGTTLTGSSGIPIITEQNAYIPAASINPPAFGYTTVSAHAINPGQSGNIPSYDINSPCCFASVIAKNPETFRGGQDERDYSTVSKQDINKLSTQLIPTLKQSMQGALTATSKQNETVSILPCSPIVAPDHNIGEEATQVKVTVSETCSAVSYSSQAVERRATDLLTHQAVQTLGTGYNLIGNVQLKITKFSVTHTSTPTVFLSFTAYSTWVYALNNKAQQHIKHLIAGKRKQDALRILLSQPGINQAIITGIDDSEKLPKNSHNIHMSIVFPESS